MKILLLDNYDSFTWNLYHLAVAVFGPDVVVLRNDDDPRLAIEGGFDAAIVSPGPGRPEREEDFGTSRVVLETLGLPTLGVCLGHQGICAFSGGRIVHAPEPVHGRALEVFHDGSALFADIPSPFRAVRYHSLTCATPLPDTLVQTAWSADGLVMGLAHRTRAQWGVQFHPESICSEHGRTLMENFARLARDAAITRRPSAPTARGASRAAPVADHVVAPATAPAGEPAAAAMAPPRRILSRRIPQAWPDEDIFLQLFADLPYAFWLDSSLADARSARFSFLGGFSADEVGAVRCRLADGGVDVLREGRARREAADLFAWLDAALVRSGVDDDTLPFDFVGGFVGYLGYELKSLCGGDAAHRSTLPDACLIEVDRFVAIDHAEQVVWLVYSGNDPAAGGAWLDRTEMRLAAEPPADRRNAATSSAGEVFTPVRGRADYLADIERCLGAIRDGESYEICLTTQFIAQTGVQPLDYYLRLRQVNPAPYSAFLRLPELAIACSSPERFLQADRHGAIESRPIKGTVRRGLGAREDFALRDVLEGDEKTRAENLMIVDLLRNDLGRVCEPGSVEVPSLMHVESYATVHQLVSTIRGRLRPDCSVVDAVRAAFPPGSMTGAPKKRTMEIIDRLEGRARGIYSGTLGYFSANGSVDLAVVIRTAVFAGGEVAIGAGGAIVAQSSPEREWEEVLLKASRPIQTFERGT